MDYEILNVFKNDIIYKNYVCSSKYYYCPSIYDKNNNIRSTQKSKFKNTFLDYIGKDCYIYDASMIIYKIPLNLTHEQAFNFLGKIYIYPLLQKNIKELHLVFDNSKYVSLAKSLTQTNRKNKNSYFKNKEERDLFINKFINWIKNNYNYKYKKIIISGLKKLNNSLLILNSKIYNNKKYTHKQGEADQGVIFHLYMTNFNEVTINSTDSDLLFLTLLHSDIHFLKDKNIKLVIEKNKTVDIKKIINTTKKMFINIKNIIPTIVLLYIISGCDYIPSFYYITKEHFFKTFIKYKNSPWLKNGLCNVSSNTIIINKDICLRFIALCYYDKYKKLFKKSDIILQDGNTGRYYIEHVHETLNRCNTDIQKIIPKIDILEKHILKSKYVLNLWIKSCKRNPKYEDILEYGWSYDLEKKKYYIENLNYSMSKNFINCK